VRVAEVCEGRGWPGHPTRGRIDESPDGIPMVQLRDADMHGGVRWGSVIRAAVERKRTERWLDEGDILFAARGARLNATVVRNVPGRVLCSPHFFHLRVRPSMATPDFVAWQMNQGPFQARIERAAEGATSSTLRIADFREIELALPSLEEQAAYASLYKAQLEERQVLESLINNREKEMKGLAVQLMRSAHLLSGVAR
jgi:hypothetical protein